MANNFFNMLNPQMKNGAQSLLQQAMQSGNPQQFLMQKFGNDPKFMQGFNMLNQQGINSLNDFIASNLK